MSNKITGRDLERLINEAMGLKMEAPNDADPFSQAAAALGNFEPDEGEDELRDFVSEPDVDDSEGADNSTDAEAPEQGDLSDAEAKNIADSITNVGKSGENLVLDISVKSLGKLSSLVKVEIEKKKYGKGEKKTLQQAAAPVFAEKIVDKGYLRVIQHLRDRSPTLNKLMSERFKNSKEIFNSIAYRLAGGFVYKSANIKVGTISSNQLVKIKTELFHAEALFVEPWNLREDTFPEYLKVDKIEDRRKAKQYNKTYSMGEIIEYLKQIASLSAPTNVLTDDDISSLMLTPATKLAKLGKAKKIEDLKEKRTKISFWLFALMDKFAAAGEAGKLNLANNLVAKIDQVSKTEYDPSARTFAPDARIKTTYRSAGSYQRTPPYIEEIFKTFSKSMSEGGGITERIKSINELANELFSSPADPNNITEDTARKLRADYDRDSATAFSKLMILDFFKTIAIDLGKSDPQHAGNVFESFLALLINGTTEGGKFDFDDVISRDSNGNISFISLKLLGMSSQVTQSYKTIHNFYAKHGKQAKLKYFVALKDVYNKESEFFRIPIYMKEVSYNEIFKEDGTFKKEFDGTYGTKTINRDGGDESENSETTDFQSYDKDIIYYPPGKKILKVGATEASQVLKTSAGSGTVVFGISHIKDGDFLGEILIPKDTKQYESKMAEKFNEVNTAIGVISKNLKEFEARITKFFAAAEPSTRKTQANSAYRNLIVMRDEMDQKIFVSTDGQVESTGETAGHTKTNIRKKGEEMHESKITPNTLKKIIEESFKR